MDEKTGRPKVGGPKTPARAVAGGFQVNPAKALVMSYVSQLVADGYADWDMLENGVVRLRCRTGETFLLGETTIIRIA
jgi:hypothetical protein